MQNPRIDESAAGEAEFTIPDGCLICGGELDVRVTPGAARSYCKACHWLSSPDVEVSPRGFKIGHSIELLA